MKTTLYTLLLFVLCYFPVVGQDKSEPSIPERVYLHTDKNIYIAGENLFYIIYLQGNPGQMSRYAYLVLRNRNNIAVARERVDLKNQMAYGNVFLPDTLPTDIYQVVCFTNYMRNEGEDSFFTNEIIIANRFDKKTELADSTNIPEHSPFITSSDQQKYMGNENRGKKLSFHLKPKTYLETLLQTFRFLFGKLYPASFIILRLQTISTVIINLMFLKDPAGIIPGFIRKLMNQ